VIGAGVIGCEYACTFAAFGIRVILVDSHRDLLPFLDVELSEHLRREMINRGIQILFEQEVESVARVGENALRVKLSGEDSFDVHSVLFSAGREANTAELGLDACGVSTDERDRIPINSHYQTSVETIYAAGDVIGFPALASSSMDQGRIAACHMFGVDTQNHLSKSIPYGIYTIPTVSTVGETEQTCLKKGIEYETGRAMYAENVRGQIVGDEAGMVKLIFCPKKLTLLGAHIIGERSTEIIHVASTVLAFNGTIDYFIQAVFNHPTVTEMYKYAAHNGLEKLSETKEGSN